MTEKLLDTNTDDQIQIDPDKNYLEELVGEGKKFKSSEELARGKAEADAYVKHMEKRLDELRSDYLKVRDENTSKAKLEELIDQLSKQQTLTSSENTLNANEDKVNRPTIDPKEIEGLVSSKLKELRTSEKQQENFNKVRAKLRERYGDNYPSILKEQIESLELTEDYADDLARTRPQVFMKTFGLDEQVSREDFQAPLKSNRRSDSFSPNVQKRTWAYYQEMKKKDSRRYWDPKTVVQMHKDAEELGEVFKDGDYNLLN